MNKNILFLACMSIVAVLPNLVLADCVNVAGFTSFSVTGANTVTLYTMHKPFVKFDVLGSIDPTSKLQLIKAYVCDGDEVLVDGFKSTILNVRSNTD